jgi:isoquinoline 1-oxidoreductase subunit beta
MTIEINQTRRSFLKNSVTVGGGLIIGFYIPTGMLMKQAMAAPSKAPILYPPNAFIRIAADSSVSIVINKCEMGQGVFTSMSQLIAEELDCDWQKIQPVAAAVDPVYNHTVFGGSQITGGSSSLSSSYMQYRKIGASARMMLTQAAAAKWGVDASTCKTANGFVTHASKGKLSFGELAEAANRLPMPKEVPLRDAKNFKFIGKSIPRLDAHEKSTGKAIYGIDVRIPDLVRVMLVRPPVFGATLKSFDAADAKKVSGVIDVVRVNDRVAVIGKNTWAARKGRDAVKAEWNMNGKDTVSSESLFADFKVIADKPALNVKSSPEAVKEASADQGALFAEYEFPYLAHAAMEPLNVTVNYDGKKAEIWSGHQMPTVDRDFAAKILGLRPDQVKVNAVYAGGSFGRRASKTADYVSEACEVAKVLKRPMQLLYSREDDMKGGYYRPFAYHRARISTAKNGVPKAWHHTIVSQSIMAGGVMEGMLAGGADPVVTEGVTNSKYDVPKMQIDLQMPRLDIPTLWFRSVGHTHTAFVMETLMDELALRGGKDSLDFRRGLLKASPRHLAVIDLLQKKSPWGKKAPQGRAYGVAVHESFNTVVGQVVEVSMTDGRPKIHHVWSAVHCGRVVNPEGAKTQVEGAIAFAMTAALYGNIAIEKGQVKTANFDTYKVLRMSEMPKVDVFFVASNDNPTGLGEPGVPPLAPALANALFKLTGNRIRKLPISLETKA